MPEVDETEFEENEVFFKVPKAPWLYKTPPVISADVETVLLKNPVPDIEEIEPLDSTETNPPVKTPSPVSVLFLRSAVIFVISPIDFINAPDTDFPPPIVIFVESIDAV